MLSTYVAINLLKCPLHHAHQSMSGGPPSRWRGPMPFRRARVWDAFLVPNVMVLSMSKILSLWWDGMTFN